MNLMPPLSPDTGEDTRKVRAPEEAITRVPSHRVQIVDEALGRTPSDAYAHRRSNSLKHYSVSEKELAEDEKDERDIRKRQVGQMRSCSALSSN